MEEIENDDCLSGIISNSTINTISRVTDTIYLSGLKPLTVQNIIDRRIGLVLCCADPGEDMIQSHQQLLQALPELIIVTIPYDDVETQSLTDTLPVTAYQARLGAGPVPYGDISELKGDASDALTISLNLLSKFKGNILVHCYAGISRSVAVVCYYLMFTQVIPFRKALKLVQCARAIADPNDGFREELISLGKLILAVNHS